MLNLRYIELHEVDLMGMHGSSVTLKVGEKICWINQGVATLGREKSSANLQIDANGDGPFVCDTIIQIPAGDTLLKFINGNGKEVKLNKEFFTTCE